MIWFAVTALLAAVGIIALLCVSVATAKVVPVAVAATAAVAWVIVTIFMSFAQVEAGHIGLVKAFSDYTGTMQPGVHAKAPWQSVTDASVRVQSKKVFMDGVEGHGSAVSAETQPVFAVTTINFHVRPDCILDLYRNVGGGYFESIIEPRVQQVFKAQTVEYRTIDVAPSREQIRSQVQSTLDGQLDRYCIDVDDFLISNLDFADEFSKSIERKQVATQDALAAQEKVRQAEAEAEQVIAAARGEAQALQLKAQAIRDNPELLRLTMIEKLAPNVQVMLVPDNGSFLLPGSLFERAQ